ncbi:Crp/Fnr family transcriptional regulator [Methylobacterium sp. GC_Met_2]|uniref:Crp/Fnr family transcriptional regulator n=1 Tax=Methylobacterium sp. GC_Met_2 TaxID=2937376 RepID=UPI00226B5F33|nr:Crp/Fnr family transcriptional regulator [Methylobacterium sp. GC_Met_2]
MGSAARLSKTEEHALRKLPVASRTFEAQQDIIYGGATSLHSCVVLDGWTCCYQLLTEGKRQILSIHVPGDMPDLQGLHLPQPDFGMAAITRAVVAFVPHTALRQLSDGSPTIAAALWRETLITAAIHRAWITSLGRRDARQRFAHLICELYLRLEAAGLASDHTMWMPLRQPDLADALGLTSVHVNRTMRSLRLDGLIDLRSRQLVIQDWDGLRALAAFSPQYLRLPNKVVPGSS